MQITSKHLQLISAIEQSGSLAKLALLLEVTPSAVSQQISKLEAELGA